MLTLRALSAGSGAPQSIDLLQLHSVNTGSVKRVMGGAIRRKNPISRHLSGLMQLSVGKRRGGLLPERALPKMYIKL